MANPNPKNQWQKGKAGGPGRPEKDYSVADMNAAESQTIAKKYHSFRPKNLTDLQALIQEAVRPNTKLDAVDVGIIKALYNLAKSGDFSKIEPLWVRILGKVKDQIEVSGALETQLPLDTLKAMAKTLLTINEDE